MARLLVAGVAAAVLALPAYVGAAGQPTGYDGHVPFECELQQAGQGTTFPHPDADPFCVEYDKTHQNVTQLGVVQFLAQEPARFAAAGVKCWYFQRDHWTGSVVQDDGSTQTYHWDGSYWFDRARGMGGVYIENFTINGKTGDPRDVPGFPDEWKPYFGPGRDPDVRHRARRPELRRKGERGAAARSVQVQRAEGVRGSRDRPLRLGMARKDAEAALGPPARTTEGVSRWCTADGGKLVAAVSGDRLAFALTTSPAFDARGIEVGEGSAAARKRYRKLAQRGGVALLAGRSSKRTLLIGVDHKRVRFIAVAGPRASAKTIDRWLDASRYGRSGPRSSVIAVARRAGANHGDKGRRFVTVALPRVRSAK